VYALHGRWWLHKTILLWGLLTITASLFFMAQGAVNNAPGALRVGTVYVLWPMVFLFFMGIVNRPEKLSPFLKVIVVASIRVALMVVMLFADSFLNFNLRIATNA